MFRAQEDRQGDRRRLLRKTPSSTTAPTTVVSRRRQSQPVNDVEGNHINQAYLQEGWNALFTRIPLQKKHDGMLFSLAFTTEEATNNDRTSARFLAICSPTLVRMTGDPPQSKRGEPLEADERVVTRGTRAPPLKPMRGYNEL